MVAAPNTNSTLTLDNGTNKTSTALSTHIIIYVNGKPVGAVQNLTINESRELSMIAEVGTDGFIDSAPRASTKISGSCDRVRFDRMRVAEAFSRSFIHVASQAYPFDIVIVDRQKRDQASQITTVIKNVWIKEISYSYSHDNWIITDKMGWEAETIFSVLNGGANPAVTGSAAYAVAQGGERGDIRSSILGADGNLKSIEQVTDTGGRRGSMDVSGIIDIGLGAGAGTVY